MKRLMAIVGELTRWFAFIASQTRPLVGFLS
jgi:hypothetical protein